MLKTTPPKPGLESALRARRGAVPKPVLDAVMFGRSLDLEQRRAERSGREFVLVDIDLRSLSKRPNSPRADALASIVAGLIRETDSAGWRGADPILGVLFTEFGGREAEAAVPILRNRIASALAATLSHEEFTKITLSFYVFPKDWDTASPPPSAGLPSQAEAEPRQHAAVLLKRALDIVGSLWALILLSPVFLVVGVLVKVTSRGPVLFRQERVGQFGRRFTFLKFRSMHYANDDSHHKNYMEQYIDGKSPNEDAAGQTVVYKINNDPRLTPIGRLIRRSSLDELPQLLNVLKGDMSLVGPRPPIPYETSCYRPWHRRRLAVKPGITGLWQVTGRSRVKFDDMVRLDLQYARTWSLWLDAKVLLKTPRAVLSGDGAL